MAGHVDHGKSALVTALTGRPMDRLAQERDRGITIELNFAAFLLADDMPAAIIDVPGHEDFVRTMVAGASGIDVALLVIAADDGIMPQTREHLLVLEQLGVHAALAVIAKADAVEPDWLALVQSEAGQWLQHSSIPFGDPVVVSSRTGLGLPELRARLAALAQAITPRDSADLFRLPIDRVFSLAGAGTVVTGSAMSGSIETGTLVRVLPAGVEARVRSIESHGATLERSTPGARTAVALAGAGREEVSRGDVLVRSDDPWEATSRLDAEVMLGREAGVMLADRSRVRLHLGAAEVMARVRIDAPLERGGSAVVRLDLEAPLVARGRDRLVLRSYSPASVIGGGWVIDPLPGSRRRTPAGLVSADAGIRLEALVERRRHGVETRLLPVLLGLPPAACAAVLQQSTRLMTAGDLVVTRDLVERLMRDLEHEVASFHRREPHATGVPLETLRHSLHVPDPVAAAALTMAEAAGRVILHAGVAALVGFKPAPQVSDSLRQQVVAAIREGGLAAPTADELAKRLGIPDALRGLVQASEAGEVILVAEGRYATAEALAGFAGVLREVGSAGDITPGAVRSRTGLSRKYLIPLLEWADRSGITQRQGESRRLRVAATPVVRGA